MSDKLYHLIGVTFATLSGAAQAEQEVRNSKLMDGVNAAIVVEKDSAGRITAHDIGLTPKKGAAGGIALGAVFGLLTGGATLALAAVGGILGNRAVKKRKLGDVTPNLKEQLSLALSPGTSAILALGHNPLSAEAEEKLEQLGGDVFTVTLTVDELQAMQQDADVAYNALAGVLQKAAEKEAAVPYPRIFVVINPVSGKDEPILNVLNRVFYRYGVAWDIAITHKYGDATRYARAAAESGQYDLVAGYGGDGTQHEIANGVMGTGVSMGVLPGGTGNGFANELKVPTTLLPAVELLCTSWNQSQVDVAQYEATDPVTTDAYFIQRIFTSIEPEEQTSREMKDKYGTFAYLIRDVDRLRNLKDITYRMVIDDEEIQVSGNKCYVVNSATAGTGLSISRQFSISDGYLDVFMLSQSIRSVEEAAIRFFKQTSADKQQYYWRGRSITIAADPPQPVWTDGEYAGRTPVTINVLPGGLKVVVP